MIDFIHQEDLLIKNGDFLLDRSDDWHAQHIIKAHKSEYKEAPELGVGIEGMLNSENSLHFLIETKKNLEYDGMKVNDIHFSDEGKLIIDGAYQSASLKTI